MGETLSKAREVATVSNDNDKKLADDAINSLMDMASLQHDVFDAKFRAQANGADRMLVPADKIVYTTQSIYACKEADATATKKAVSGIIGNFASGDFLEGITSTISTGLDLLLGSYSGSKSERTDYLISVGPLGGVYRLDYFFYAYR